MDTAVIVMEHTYDAPVDKVWQTLTDLSKIDEWFFKLEDLKAGLGFVLSFSGNDKDEKKIHKCVITELIHARKLSYSFIYKDYPQRSEVTFTLFPEGEKTRLILTHSDLNNKNINIKNKYNESRAICN